MSVAKHVLHDMQQLTIELHNDRETPGGNDEVKSLIPLCFVNNLNEWTITF